MSQTVKANGTLDNLKKASSVLATVLKLLVRFFTQLGSRFDGGTIASQRSQCGPKQLHQQEDEAREARETLFGQVEDDRIRQVEDHIRQAEDHIRQAEADHIRHVERLYRDAAAHPITYEGVKTLNQVDTARRAWEERNRGLDGPSIDR